MGLYLITFDTNSTDSILAHEAITRLPSCEWWHFIAGSYLITCADDLPTVREHILSQWPGGPMFIAPLSKSPDGYSPDGLLPDEAWAWINARM